MSSLNKSLWTNEGATLGANDVVLRPGHSASQSVCSRRPNGMAIFQSFTWGDTAIAPKVLVGRLRHVLNLPVLCSCYRSLNNGLGLANKTNTQGVRSRRNC